VRENSESGSAGPASWRTTSRQAPPPTPTDGVSAPGPSARGKLRATSVQLPAVSARSTATLARTPAAGGQAIANSSVSPLRGAIGITVPAASATPAQWRSA
jgi:hypothetical protein